MVPRTPSLQNFVWKLFARTLLGKEQVCQGPTQVRVRSHHAAHSSGKSCCCSDTRAERARVAAVTQFFLAFLSKYLVSHISEGVPFASWTAHNYRNCRRHCLQKPCRE